jgi:hypothetical protein
VPEQPVYAHCNRCSSDTWHLIAGQCKNKSEEILEGGDVISFAQTSDLLECKVCKQTQLRVTSWNSENEWLPPSFFPPPSKHKAPDWLHDLSPEYSKLAHEIYPALDAGSFCLALMGTRALLDVYVTRHSGVSNDFTTKLKKLQDQGAISAKQIEILTPAFDAGSAAAHRGYVPSEENIIVALQVVENLIQQDILAIKTAKLKSDTPQRQKNK